MKCTASCSGRPGPTDRTLRLVKQNVQNNPHCNASDIAKTVDVSARTAVAYLHKLGYCGRDARRKPQLGPSNIKRRKELAHEVVERSVDFG